MASALWEIRLFGGLSLQCGERRESKFRTQKTSSLLAYLALFPNRTHPREELAVRFWGDDGDEEARRSLRVSLNSLRRQLETPNASEGELIIADRTTIGLRREAFTTDVFRFEDTLTKATRLLRTAPENYEERVALLQQALALYDAPLLPGFYDDWVLDERERLHSRFLDALEEAEKLLLKLGRTAEADSVAQRRDQSESSDKVAGTGIVEIPAHEPKVADSAKTTAITEQTLPTTSPLPYFFTRFFGREREMNEVITHLNDPLVSVITLLGPGGIGKTRLSVEAARAWGQSVVWVPLASVVRGEEITDVLRDALKVAPSSSGAGDWENVTAYLRERAAAGPAPLLVFDNFEQVEEESGARFVARLLRSVPGVRCLVSSRRRLGVPGEFLYAVETFPLPGDGESDVATLLANPSVALFVDRARSATPDFAVTARNATAVATLCRLLDGLPLALELAAAWASVFPPGQMAQKIAAQGERWELLESRKQADRVERHRSLWNAIAWSYELLPPDLQKLWRGLYIFHGGFTADMAKTVAGEVFSLDGLARLRERSLIRLMEEVEGDDPDESRYELLESLREFAGEQVAAQETADEQAELRLRHAKSLQQIITIADASENHKNYNIFTLRYKRELPNIRKALNSAEEGILPVEIGLEIAVGVGRLWKTGYLREGYGFLSALLRRAEEEGGIPAALKGNCLHDISRLSRFRGEFSIAAQQTEEAIVLYRQEGNKKGLARSLASLGDVAQMQNDFAKARLCLTEALTLAREEQNTPVIATTLHNLGNLAYLEDDYVAMQELTEEELIVRREVGEDGGIAQATSNLAIAARERGEFAASEAYSWETARLFYGIGDFYSLATTFLLYAELMIATQEWDRASISYGIGMARNEEQGVVLSAATLDYVAQCQQKCRDAIGDKSFGQGLQKGLAMPIAETIAFLQRKMK